MITAEDIRLSFGGLCAVDGCNLSVEEGTITGLIGPNGAGKSTLFGILTGFIRPDSGRILFDGEDVTGMRPHQLFRRGLVRTFQIPQEFQRMTVRENLMLPPLEQVGERLLSAWFRPGRVHQQEREIAAKADEVLGFLELTRVADELAGNLSGGQKKLLELGRTMMTSAKVVLLDEPGAGVNRTLLAKLCGYIRRLNEEWGYTICIIEHDMDLIADLCHPVVVMAQGRVIAEGPMEEIRRNPEVLDAYLGGTAGAAASGVAQ